MILTLLTWAILATAQSQPVSAELEWLSGCWTVKSGSRVVTEYWLPAEGSILLGVSQTVAGGQTREHEFLLIRKVDGVWEYVASPSGQATTSFRATSSGSRQITFENPTHDFPQVISYKRDGNSLVARVSGAMNGKQRAIEFNYSRCASP